MKILDLILCSCWIGFYVVMYNLKICYDCYLKLYFFIGFYKHVRAGRDGGNPTSLGRRWSKSTLLLGFGGGDRENGELGTRVG